MASRFTFFLLQDISYNKLDIPYNISDILFNLILYIKYLKLEKLVKRLGVVFMCHYQCEVCKSMRSINLLCGKIFFFFSIPVAGTV